MKNMKLSVKLVGGFVIVAFITLGVGIVGWNSMSTLMSDLVHVSQVNLPSIQNILTMDSELDSIRVAQRTLLNPNLNREDRQRQYENVAEARESFKKVWEIYDRLPRSPEEDKLWKEFTPAMEAWNKGSDEFFRACQELEKMDILNPLSLVKDIEQFTKDHYKRLNETLKLIYTGQKFTGGEDAAQCAFSKWMAQFKTDNPVVRDSLKEIVEYHDKFHHSIKMIKDSMDTAGSSAEAITAASTLYEKEMVPSAKKVFELFTVMREQAGMAENMYNKINEQAMITLRAKQVEAKKLLNEIVEMNEQSAIREQEEADKNAKRSQFMVVSGMITGFAAALALGIFLTLSISRPLLRVITGLSDGSAQVASASGQVSSASQQLAEGASEQAASLEETSSSLEEMAAMTRQNADNANQVNSLMKEVSQVVGTANQSMSQLTVSMDDISRASDETSKIIKTIDEIAFQTNLLALNAAVEAARAGEAGAGFAVVADEVRNLAMRAAEAAKNTANLIEGTVKKVKEGSGLVTKTNEAFSEVATSTGRVTELSAEVAAASNEQSQGIEQVNKAVAEMDKVIQQNAANAEESASASEEMNAQAEQMKGFVGDLAALVGGSRNGKNNGRVLLEEHAHPQNVLRKVISHANPAKRSSSKDLTMPHAKEVRPDQVIPLHEEKFKDF